MVQTILMLGRILKVRLEVFQHHVSFVESDRPQPESL